MRDYISTVNSLRSIWNWKCKVCEWVSLYEYPLWVSHYEILIMRAFDWNSVQLSQYPLGTVERDKFDQAFRVAALIKRNCTHESDYYPFGRLQFVINHDQKLSTLWSVALWRDTLWRDTKRLRMSIRHKMFKSTKWTPFNGHCWSLYTEQIRRCEFLGSPSGVFVKKAVIECILQRFICELFAPKLSPNWRIQIEFVE